MDAGVVVLVVVVAVAAVGVARVGGRSPAPGGSALAAQLAATAEQTASLTTTASALREVLASPKARGQWGERMAEDVLRLAGMVEGVSYVRQRATRAGTVPDVTFLLPG